MPGLVIRTPATTANFGPGFDCVGIAINLYNELKAEWTDISTSRLSSLELAEWLQTNVKITITGEGERELSKNNMGLFFKSLSSILFLPDKGGIQPENLVVKFNNGIPLARGLGSSAACIVSALCLGREILKANGIEVEEKLLLSKAIEMDHYPDNVLPAYFGGGSINIVNKEGVPMVFPFEIPKELNFIFLIPEIKINSAEARKILPKTVPLKDAVRNSALLSALLLSLNRKKFNCLKELMESPLHIPFRSQLIPCYTMLKETAYKEGALAFTISGAGSTVVALATDNYRTIGEAMLNCYRLAGFEARYIICTLEPNGTRVERMLY